MNHVRTNDIFSTAIWDSKLPNFENLKVSFLDTLRLERKLNPEGVHKSNHNGYQSIDTLAVTYEQEFRPLFKHIMEVMVPEIIKDCGFFVSSGDISGCWANFNEGGYTSNEVHIHNGTLSGVFYINTPPGSGDLVFINSGINNLWGGIFLASNNMSGERYVAPSNKYTAPFVHFKPQEGYIHIWNSSIPHYVNPNSADVERVSMSFNINLFNKENDR